MNKPDGELYVNGEYVECGIEKAGVSEKDVQSELKKRGDYFNDALDTDAVQGAWVAVASLPVCQLGEDSSNRLLLEYAITANRWINKMNEIIEDGMNDT